MKQVETIAQIKEKLQSENINQQYLNRLKNDDRIGVRKLVKQYEKQQEQLKIEREKFEKMTEIEYRLYEKNYKLIAGIDEVGRGPLAGPVVAAAVILPRDFELIGLNDSKQLNEDKRNKFYEIICEQALDIGIGISGNDEIDEINIFEATKLAMKRAVLDLNKAPSYLLIDAVQLNDLPIEQQSIIKGDSKSISIAAASIVAKVTRDSMMKKLHEQYPMFHFISNMGYGTKEHLEALKQFGPSPVHRKSFKPVSDLV